MFKNSSFSYSQFLPSKNNAVVHSFAESEVSSIDIEFFRRSVLMHYQQVYVTKKRESWIYRIVFFSLSLLFAVLGTLIFFKTANFTCGLYFGTYAVKHWVNVSCLIISSGAFSIGYWMHPEREAIHHIVSRMENEWKNISKQLQLEINSIFAEVVTSETIHSQTL